MKKCGFTLLEVLIGSFLILVVFLGILGAFRFGVEVSGFIKAKVIASQIAIEEIEKVRALAYENIGIVGGFPSGVLQPRENKTLNNINFTITRRVDYIADSQDGLALPQDDCPNDYKRTEIKVSWERPLRGGEALVVSDFSPPNLAKECSEQAGLLTVVVFNAFGNLVQSPLIEVLNPQTLQVLKSALPENGQHTFVLAPGIYRVQVSKPGYSSERTYGQDEIAIPFREHPRILQGQLTQISLPIDKLSSMEVNTKLNDERQTPLGNVIFNLRGQKIIGQDAQEQPVYKYNQNHTSDSQGRVTISGLEWDTYEFSVDPSLTNLDLVSTQPTQPISLAPDTTLQVTLFLEARNSLLITVQDLNTQEPIFSAQARLTNSQLNYDQTLNTDQAGQAFFVPLAQGSYNIQIQALGYEGLESTIQISGQTQKTYKLRRIE